MCDDAKLTYDVSDNADNLSMIVGGRWGYSLVITTSGEFEMGEVKHYWVYLALFSGLLLVKVVEGLVKLIT